MFAFLAYPAILRRAMRHGMLLACLWVCALSPAWALAGTAEANLALEPVSLQLRWMHQFQFAGYYAALHKGYYWEAGLDVTLKEGGPGADPVADVLAGKSDFGISVSSLVIDFLKGKPLLMLGPVFQHSPNILLAHGRNRLLIDLIGNGGGKIAMMGGNQDVELQAMFLNEGIALDKLPIVPDERHLEDLIERRVAAINGYASNEPFILDQLGVPYTILKPQTYGMDFYGDLLFTRQALADERPEVVAAFWAASLRGWHYALDHPREIIDLILERYNTQNKSREHLAYEARELHHLIHPEVIEIGHNNPGRWRHIADTYERFGLVEADQPLDDFFYQRDLEGDLTRVYLALGTTVAVMLVVGGIALVIHRVNRRLALALDEKSRSEERHRILFQTSPSAGLVWHEGFIVTNWNRQAEALFGWQREEVLGKRFVDFLLPAAERDRLAPELSHLTQDQLPAHRINDNLTRDGRVLTCEWFNAWLPERPGEPREVVSLAIDITERRRLEEEIQQLAFFDPLTRLPNRRLLQDRLGRIMAAARRNRRHGALMFLDLDNFKPLNDTHGHEIGDLLLVETARRLQGSVRASDTIARFGGDEFVVLLGDLDGDETRARDQAEGVAGKIRAALTEPFRLPRPKGAGLVEHRCTASIGVALFDGLGSEEDALRRADTAMYRAKQGGRNRVAVDAALSRTPPLRAPERREWVLA